MEDFRCGDSEELQKLIDVVNVYLLASGNEPTYIVPSRTTGTISPYTV